MIKINQEASFVCLICKDAMFKHILIEECGNL